MKGKKAGEVELTDLLEAGCHFGHVSRRWQPKMAKYIYARRDNIQIFDLVKTREGLIEAAEFLRRAVAAGKRVWFVGTKRQGQAIVKEEAKKVGVPYVTTRWLGGTITNWEQIKKSINKLKKLREGREKGEFAERTKYEKVQIDREINKLERFLGGIADEPSPPEVLFVLDAHREKAAVKEARQKGITIVAVVDSNTDPTGIDYVIPANDDAVRSIKLLVSELAQAYAEGLELKKKGARPGQAEPKVKAESKEKQLREPEEVKKKTKTQAKPKKIKTSSSKKKKPIKKTSKN